MQRSRVLLASVVGAALCSAVGWSAAEKKLPPPASLIGVRPASAPLVDAGGKNRRLVDFKGKKALVVIFLGTECPIANAYAARLNELAAKYRPQGVEFVGVNANPEDTVAEMAKHATDFQLTFPVWKDPQQALADALGARTTPEAFVLNSEQTVQYRGRIDDSYASRTRKNSRVSHRDLELALDAVLAGRKVATPVTTVLGCAIPRPERLVLASGAPTFHKDVAGILQKQCQDCHRPGQVAPFSLLTYTDAKNWAAEIKTFVSSRQMPPWKPESGHGDFEGVRRLSDEEIRTVGQWVDAGAPEGNPSDSPKPRTWDNEWMLGKPDLILKVPETYNVAASGEDDFRCFVLPTGLTEDRDVIAIEVKPGNPRVVHHVLNFVDTRGRGRALDERDPGPGYASGAGGVGFFPEIMMGGWAPGNLPRFLPTGIGRRLPKGSDMVIQVHYHKTGKPEADQTSLGIYFAKEPVKLQARTWPLTNLLIDIPAGATRHEIKAQVKLPMDVTALAVTPHMHLLGKEIKLTATLPDGQVKSLVWIKDWDYRWQDTYFYKDPVPLPRGTQLNLSGFYDNSSNNPLNPNSPPKRVTFGEQTTDEMCFAFLEFYTNPTGSAVKPAATSFNLFK